MIWKRDVSKEVEEGYFDFNAVYNKEKSIYEISLVEPILYNPEKPDEGFYNYHLEADHVQYSNFGSAHNYIQVYRGNPNDYRDTFNKKELIAEMPVNNEVNPDNLANLTFRDLFENVEHTLNTYFNERKRFEEKVQSVFKQLKEGIEADREQVVQLIALELAMSKLNEVMESIKVSKDRMIENFVIHNQIVQKKKNDKLKNAIDKVVNEKKQVKIELD